MGEPVMLQEQDVVRIGDYVKPWLRELVDRMAPRAEADVGPALLERMVRVEEELRAQRELMDERFKFMERRFAESDRRITERFEASDQRITERFEASDQRIAERFEASDQRIADLIAQIDKRFDAVDKRFNALTWMIGVGFVVITSLTTVFALLA